MKCLILYYISMTEGTIFQGNFPPQQPEVTPPVNQNQMPPQNIQPVVSNPPQVVSPPPPPPVPLERSKSKFPARNIFKIFLGIVGVLVIVFLIFAVIAPKLRGNNQSGQATLTYWGLWEDPNVMNVIISDFEKQNPNIKINYIREDPKEYKDRLLVRIPNGNGPDIFRYHNSWYPMLSSYLLPLPENTINKTQFSDNFYGVAQQDLVKNGAIYGIPLEVDTLAMFVNPALLNGAQIPSTWQEFIDTTSAITKRDDQGKITIAGGAVGTYENISHAPDIISLLFAQNGVDLSDPGKSTDKISSALTFYTDFSSVENSVWDGSLDNSILSFSQGKVGMIFGYSYDYFTIKAQSPNLNFEIVPVPQLSKENPVNIASYWAEGVSAKTKNPEAAFLFMKYLATPQVEEKLYAEESKTRLFGEPYANKSLVDKLKDSQVNVFASQAKSAVSSPYVDSTYDNGLNTKLDNYLKDSVNAILAGDSADSATQTLLDGYSQVMSLYGTPKPSQ